MTTLTETRTPQSSEWFARWFDSRHYHDLYAHRDESEAATFIAELVRRLRPRHEAGPDQRELIVREGRAGERRLFLEVLPQHIERGHRASTCIQSCARNGSGGSVAKDAKLYQVELEDDKIDFLQKMVAAHALPDVGKAIRCLINYARENPDKHADIFDEIRCLDC